MDDMPGGRDVYYPNCGYKDLSCEQTPIKNPFHNWRGFLLSLEGDFPSKDLQEN